MGPAAQYPAANFDAEDAVLAVTDPATEAYHALRAGIRDRLARDGSRRDVVLDPTRLAFSGFSSGGNLALNLVLGTKNDPTVNADWPSPVAAVKNPIPVLLFYPSLDCRLLPHERPDPEDVVVEGDGDGDGDDDADNPKPRAPRAPRGFVERWRIEAELMPTYLPPDKRAHPRASPGLADVTPPNDASTTAASTTAGLHPRAKLFLVLPQFDSLHRQSLTWIDKVRRQGRGDDLVVEHVPGVRHGWTQFPDAWLDDEAKRRKYEVFQKAREFVQACWDNSSARPVEAKAEGEQ